MSINLVAYYRVSTDKQEKSGLGLAAQEQIVRYYADKESAAIIKTFTEAATGKDVDRPELQAAISYCQKNSARLIVAKLDRLSRDVEHTFQIVKKLGDGNLICGDLPATDSLTLSIFAGLAQREREIISIRTKSALRELKKRGVTLGKPDNFTRSARSLGPERRRAQSRENVNNRRATPLILEYRKRQFTYQQVADKLNASGFVTSTGQSFHRTTVMRLEKRALPPILKE